MTQDDFSEDRFGIDAGGEADFHEREHSATCAANASAECGIMSAANVGDECPLSDLDELREQIGCIDGHILDLLIEREDVVREIAQVKKRESLPIEDKGREGELIAIQKALAEDNGTDPDYIEQIWEIIIKHSKKVQKNEQEK